MYIHKAISFCVAFAAARKSEWELTGTVFFAVHRVPNSSYFLPLVITARHVVEKTCEKSVDGKFYVRVNTQDRRHVLIEMDQSDWEFHDDGRIDVAVAVMKWSEEDWLKQYDHLPISTDDFITEQMIVDLNIMPGEELYFPGLFVRAPGVESNIPILRTGSIAAMPHEAIKTTLGLARCYLAELRSIGGHSGSPVFVHFAPHDQSWVTNRLNSQVKPGKAVSGTDLEYSFPMLGLMHGYYPLKPDQLTAFVTGASTVPTQPNPEDFNSGIAVIIPASEILRVLGQPRFVKKYEEIASKEIASRGTTVETGREPGSDSSVK
jgi:hypothetical protein